MPKKKKIPETAINEAEDAALLEEAKRIMGPTPEELKHASDAKRETPKVTLKELEDPLEPVDSVPISKLAQKIRVIEEKESNEEVEAPEVLTPIDPAPVIDPQKTLEELSYQAPAETSQPEPAKSEVIDAFSNDPGLTSVVKEIAVESEPQSSASQPENPESIPPTPSVFEPPKKNHIKEWLLDLWHDKKRRKIAFIGLMTVFILIFSIPVSRYFVMNTVGVRVSARVIVVDDISNQPIPNVEVKIGNTIAKTNDAGEVVLSSLKQGRQKLQIVKRSFASQEMMVTIGFGSNPFDVFRLIPKGEKYTFILSDQMSGKPVAGAEVTDGESRAFSDEKGQVELIIESGGSNTISLQAKGAHYRTEAFEINPDEFSAKEIKLVAASPLIFLSTRDATRDVYKIDADGKNEELLLKGTGTERANMQLIASQDGAYAALASSRDDEFNGDGYRLDGLFIIETATKKVTKIDSGEVIELLGFHDGRLAYVKVSAGVSADNPERHRLLSYRFSDGLTIELAKSNYFTDARLVDDTIYYSASSNTDDQGDGFASITIGGESKRKIMDTQIWSVYWSDFTELTLQSEGNLWWKYTIGEETSIPVGAQSGTKNKDFVINTDGKKAAWSENRDGKYVIVLYDIEEKSDTPIAILGEGAFPLRWLSDKHLVFRVVGSETADYVVNVEGGEPVKVVDITPTNNNRWIRSNYGY